MSDKENKKTGPNKQAAEPVYYFSHELYQRTGQQVLPALILGRIEWMQDRSKQNKINEHQGVHWAVISRARLDSYFHPWTADQMETALRHLLDLRLIHWVVLNNRLAWRSLRHEQQKTPKQ